MRTGLALLLVVFATSCSSIDLSNQTHPASFAGAGIEYFPDIEMPEIDFEGRVIIRGAYALRSSGKISTLYLYSAPINREIHEPFEQAVQGALDRNRKLNPAMINGKNVPVLFNFSVVFENSDAGKTIVVYPNHLSHPDLFANDLAYHSPQRVGALRSPYPCSRQIETLLVAAHIDDTGRVADTRVLDSEGSDTCISNMTARIQQARFIPASYEGSFVEGDYTYLHAGSQDSRRNTGAYINPGYWESGVFNGYSNPRDQVEQLISTSGSPWR